jgi:hypothetical protein
MSLAAIVILVVVLLAVFPRTGAYSADFGYYPVGGVGLVVLILVVLLLTHRP